MNNSLKVEMQTNLLRWFPSLDRDTINDYVRLASEEGIEDATIMAEWIESDFDIEVVGFEPIIL